MGEEFSRRNSALRGKRVRPHRIIIVSYISAIILGTLLLLLPWSTVKGRIELIDALFTATSAICVTGLVVVDTGTYFTPFGQFVILLLIQIGGLGIMTFSTAFFLFMGRRISFKERIIIQETFTGYPRKDLIGLVKSIMLFTFSIEFAGFLLLYLSWWKVFGIRKALWISAFHAVSAFCNAGFSMFPNSLENFRDNYIVNIVVASLIIIGGIGFLVLHEIKDKVILQKVNEPLSLHTKITLFITGLLIIVGTFLILFIEDRHILNGMTFREKLLCSFFQSVTARTAGFNTLPISKLTNAALFVLICLMFIGASPGSTGGGIKTTTAGVLLFLIRAHLKGIRDVYAFNRTVSQEAVVKALTVFLTSFLLINLVFPIVMIVEGGGNENFVRILFECFSAFGTVGLSTGITPGLTWAGKSLIIFLMYIGRIGPLTIVLASGVSDSRRKYRFSEEKVMVG